MPFLRDGGDWGRQVIEPRIQLVSGPMTGSQYRIPNEDSIVFDFTDANLFSLNRFTGRDRQEGGTRADMALRGAWFLPGSRQVEAIVGRSFRVQDDGGPFYPYSGLENRASDWVSRFTFRPSSWLDLTGRARRGGESFAARAYDVSATILPSNDTAFTVGYLQAPPAPYLNPVAQREEIYLAASQRIGLWRFSAFGRQDKSIARWPPVFPPCMRMSASFSKHASSGAMPRIHRPATFTRGLPCCFSALASKPLAMSD
jgi:LPS-assembly protein